MGFILVELNLVNIKRTQKERLRAVISRNTALLSFSVS